ncbi:hypothetical protein HYPSUDRAFT_197177 [Hypholoma sublateritium FD-334 SS-4]|uniref:DEAD/DEAH-box helicase domain-containing protein n=1 Tax=Hypholoma sublateritium (strain FD-334 SS-4) TaxID=945553 RepID=A0A0D2QBS4_HYPSF|nr:hypothetical protein HYPSUDRAFT_197177 [Hypholoma sublateritium FD-334 SS-4]
MSNNQYRHHSGQAEQADFWTTIGCIQACLDFQKHIGIGQVRPYSLMCNLETALQPVATSQGSFATAEQLVTSLLPTITCALEETVKETILNSITDAMAHLLPKVPRPLDENNLHLISDIEPHPSRLQSLRMFLRSPDANFTCPEQAILLELMCHGTQSILGILGTGKGKTMMMFLYAHLFGSDSVTIAIFPLSLLVGEFMRRAQELGVSASIWTPLDKHSADVVLMCVSIEHLTFPAFCKELVRLHNKKSLKLIVFDEIHKMLMDKDYHTMFN